MNGTRTRPIRNPLPGTLSQPPLQPPAQNGVPAFTFLVRANLSGTTAIYGYNQRPESLTIRIGIGQITKLTVLPRLELFLQSEPLAVSESQGVTAAHVGEVFAGVQGVLYEGHDSRPTISVSYTRRLYTGPAPELDIGTFRQSGTILLSDDLYGFHIDANGILAEQIAGAVHRAQFGHTLSVSHPLGRFTVSGEIWHFSQPFLRGNAVGNLWALSHAVRRNLVVDAGFDHGLTHTSTHWEIFLAFTYLLPHRLWPDHRNDRRQAPESYGINGSKPGL